MRRLSTSILLGLALCAASLPFAPAARADFHAMQISEVFGGTAADPTAQFIELTMLGSGQGNVGGHPIVVYNATNNVVGTFTFGPGRMDNEGLGDKILIATLDAVNLFGVPSDLLMSSAAMLPAGGKVCFDPGGVFGTVDCMGWGTYNGIDVGTPFNAATGLSDPSGQSAQRTGTTDTNNSNADFTFQSPTPTNNAGQTFPDVVAPTTTIVARPANPTVNTTPTFTYTANESGVIFECSMDSEVTFSDCPNTGITIDPALDLGSHTFRVLATDAAVNVGAPAAYTFEVAATVTDTLDPTTLIGSPLAGARLRKATFPGFSGTAVDAESDDETVTGIATVEVALRQRTKKNKCNWWTETAYVRGPCDVPIFHEADLTGSDWVYAYTGTFKATYGPKKKVKLKNYSFFSRATDGEGNVETFHGNTFEIR